MIIKKEVAIYNDKFIVIGYEIQTLKLNEHNFYEIVGRQRFLF